MVISAIVYRPKKVCHGASRNRAKRVIATSGVKRNTIFCPPSSSRTDRHVVSIINGNGDQIEQRRLRELRVTQRNEQQGPFREKEQKAKAKEASACLPKSTVHAGFGKLADKKDVGREPTLEHVYTEYR